MIACRLQFLSLLSVMLMVGCGNPYERTDEDLEAMAGEPLKETVPVSGTVTLDGFPAPGLMIYAYTRESGTEAADRCDVRDDGTFCFSHYRACDGMQPGSYRLGFAQFDDNVKWNERTDLLEGKYSNPMKHDFVLEVVSGEAQSGLLYELTSDPYRDRKVLLSLR